jgi:hypothetical protein
MHKIAATALAMPALAQTYVTTLVRKFRGQTAPRRMATVGLVAVLVVGMIVTGAVALAPSVPSGPPPAGTISGGTDMAPNSPLQVHFTAAMDQASVSGAISVQPVTPVKLVWDVTGRVVSVMPVEPWAPYTYYLITVGTTARDTSGRPIGKPINVGFETGSRTAGQIVATKPVGALVSITSAFQISFTRPVKLSTVMLDLAIVPPVAVTISGDDPKDQNSQVFTITPKAPLALNTKYSVTFKSTGATDITGSTIQNVDTLAATTIAGPSIVRFRPFDRGYAFDPNQLVSVRFTEPMDTASTEAAFSVTANGQAVTGSKYWVENNTVLVLDPATPFAVGQTVIARIAKTALAADGRPIQAAGRATFYMARPEVKNIPWTGGRASSTSPWYASEVYYLRLVNCTRTGRWVTPSGACSTATHHTMPAQDALTLDRGISNLVSRPYAKYMADNRLLDHFINGTTPHYRLSAQGYTSRDNGENIASPSTSGKAGMVAVEIFFQNESPCRCEHYYNIMYPYFRTAGIGVWVSSKSHVTRVVMDFYG